METVQNTVDRQAQASGTTKWAIDPAHSSVTFGVRHMMVSTVRGEFQKVTGTVLWDPTRPEATSIEASIDVASINTREAQRDTHLKSADFFNVAVNPTAKFVGDKFTFYGDKVTAIAGTLTLNGKTNPITLKANNFNCYTNPMFKREVCGGDFEATIQRSQFGMNAYAAVGADSVRLLIQVEAIKAQ